MTLSEHVFLYCERGTNGAFLAEPFNAGSNAAFLLARLPGFCFCCAAQQASGAPTSFCLWRSCS